MNSKSDQEHFVELIAGNRGIIYKICQTYCPNRTDQEDLAQEILLTLWKGIRKYDPALPFTTWMYKVALNVAISWYRRSRRLGTTVPFGEDQLGIAEQGAWQGAGQELGAPAGGWDKADLLGRHIALLPPLDRALIFLYFEERPYREIAEVLGISVTNVATRLSRIKEKLKNDLTRHGSGISKT